jgi:hypothetical protein
LLQRLQQFPALDTRRKSCRLRVRLVALTHAGGRRRTVAAAV